MAPLTNDYVCYMDAGRVALVTSAWETPPIIVKLSNGVIMARQSPFAVHGGIAAILSILLAVGLWYGLMGRWTVPAWLAAWLLAVNLVAVLYYGFDKFQAKQGGGRVPELILHGLAVGGGSIGAYLGMKLFRHKTVKGSFQIMFWLIVAVQVGLLVWVSYMLWQGHSDT